MFAESYGTPERVAATAKPTSPQVVYSSGDSVALLVKSRDALKNACAKIVCGACKAPSPSLLVEGDEILCADCASENAVIIPVALTEAIKEIRSVYGEITDHLHVTPRLKIRPKKTLSPDKATPSPPHAEGFQSLNPNLTLSKAATPFTDGPPTDSFDIGFSLAQEAVRANEMRERDVLSTLEAQERADLHKQQSAHLKQTKSKLRDSSRNLKSTGDRKYEEMLYEVAIECYTKALKINDGTASLTAIYGNRSAAHFMLHMWSESIEDCLAAVDADVGGNPHSHAKLFSRAAKAASCMGLLRRASDFLGMIPETARNAEIEQERLRFTRGADQIDSLDNMPPREALDTLRMLVADFTESIPLRVRLSNLFMSQGEYARADATLELIPTLTAEIALLRARALYMQGFERVPDAIKMLECFADVPQVQSELQRVTGMENGKQTGNNFFSNSRYPESVEQYTMALAHAEGIPQIMKILYCNRAASYKEMKKYREGLEDCTRAIEIDSKFGKAYTRRARCLLALECYAGAMRDFQKALSLTQSPDEARTLEAEIRGVERSEKIAAERDRDFYAVLDLNPQTTTDKDIKKQYKILSLRYHPDKCVSQSEDEREAAERKFKKIVEAYGVLSDDAKRREYDFKRQRSAMPDFRFTDPTRPRYNAPPAWTRQPGKFW